jgi:hypothetical protein
MTKPPDKSPKANPNADRAERQAAALRENLLKRKDQARRRQDAKAEPAPRDGLPKPPGQPQ